LKLISKSILYFFPITIAVFITGGVIYYLKTRSMIYHQVDSSLISEKDIIQEEIEKIQDIPDFYAVPGQKIDVKLLARETRPFQHFSDTLIKNPDTGEEEAFRMLDYKNSLKNGGGYHINIMEIFDEKRELLQYITVSLFISLLSLLFISLIIYYIISRRIWHPFYYTLNQVNRFNINSEVPLKLEEPGIYEFRQLNKVLTHMAQKVQNDYKSLREFNENASHELQTPLSVISSQLELMQQMENLNESQIKIMQVIYGSVQRLSKLNQGLLLISKIENEQFNISEEINLNTIIDKIYNEFEELLNLRKIRIEKYFNDEVILKMNPVLAEILISNLLSNAVRYNIVDGFIRITTGKSNLSIVNSGTELKANPSELFERFRKANQAGEGVGLGLYIVRKICDTYGFTARYLYKDSVHEIQINFKCPD
jgi:signal transduction histidine kinase